MRDEGIFKAVFVIGTPGAGKTYTIKAFKSSAQSKSSLLNPAVGPIIVNTDVTTEFLAKKWGIKADDSTWEKFQDKTSKMTLTALANYVNGVLPLFVESTTSSIDSIKRRMRILKSLGYDVGVVFVKTALESAQQRAASREAEIGRVVDPSYLQASHASSVQGAEHIRDHLRSIHGQTAFFKEIDNTSGILDNAAMRAAFVEVESFFRHPLQNKIGKDHLAGMRAADAAYLVPAIMSMDELKSHLQGWYE